MTRRMTFGLVLALAAPLTLAQPQPPTPQFQATMDFVAALRAKDVAKAMTFFARDSVVMSPSGELASGLGEIEAVLKRLVDLGALKLAISSFGSGSESAIGYNTGTWEAAITPASGPERKHSGKYVVVMRKGDGERWQFYYTMWSLAPATSPATS